MIPILFFIGKTNISTCLSTRGTNKIEHYMAVPLSFAESLKNQQLNTTHALLFFLFPIFP